MLSPSSLSRPVVASAIVLIVIGLLIALAYARSRAKHIQNTNLAIGFKFLQEAAQLAKKDPVHAKVLLDAAVAYNSMPELTSASGIDCANLSMCISRSLQE